jgi:hypothetical protein
MLSWPEAQGLVGVSADGTVARSEDGATWQRVGDVGGQPAAFDGASAEELYVALHDGTIKRSTEAGSWSVGSTP